MPTGEHRNSLLPGYKLHWYHIEAILGQGGFGITYLATDTNLNQKVAIKEYLPVEMAVRQDNISIHPVSGEHGEQFRWGLERFISEARTLARFKHPNIVRVLAVFRENNTAYMVMEYEHGKPLHEILKEKKTLPEGDLKNILFPILDGLEAVHKAGFIHRDIKPPNIYVREDNSPVLLDFGSARQSFSEITRTLTTMVSPGYAPFEQYVGKSDRQGPWTDIYGLGATLYRATTGIPPPDSMDRSEAILHTGKDIFVSASEIAAGKYSAEFLAAIDQAMAFKTDDRPQSIAEWRDVFSAKNITPRHETDSEAPTVAAATVPAVSVDATASETAAQGFFSSFIDSFYGITKKLIKWGLVLIGILIIIGILNHAARKKEQKQTEQVPAESIVAPEEIPVEKEKPKTTEVLKQEPTPADQIGALLKAARKNIDDLRLTTPAGDNALEKYNTVLAIETGNREALQGIDRIVEEYIRLVDNAINSNNLPKAELYLQKATRVNPDHPAIGPARARYERARLQQQRLEQVKQPVPAETPVSKPAPAMTPEPEPAPPAQTESISRIPAAERQELESIRQRLRQNPQDRQARRELRELANRFEQNIRQAVNDGDYNLAREYIHEVQSNTEQGSKAYKRLNELLMVINKREAGN